jgi:hypothetical protein
LSDLVGGISSGEGFFDQRHEDAADMLEPLEKLSFLFL